jgi:hypothetical protein
LSDSATPGQNHHHQEEGKIMALGMKARNRAEQGIADRTPFVSASMSGKLHSDWHGVSLGSLSPDDRPSDVSGPVYVVYSYRTPIAWYAAGKWTVPATRYSMTTSNHQGIARVAISRAYGV